jgi:hypothetical protein
LLPEVKGVVEPGLTGGIQSSIVGTVGTPLCRSEVAVLDCGAMRHLLQVGSNGVASITRVLP